MTMETIFLIVLAAFNVWTIYFYNKLLLEVANDKEKEKKPPIDPMALVGKSLFKVSQLRKKEETEQKQTESMSVSDNDVTFDDSPKSTARISDEQLDDVFTNVRIEDIDVKYSDNEEDADVPQAKGSSFEDIDAAVNTVKHRKQRTRRKDMQARFSMRWMATNSMRNSWRTARSARRTSMITSPSTCKLTRL